MMTTPAITLDTACTCSDPYGAHACGQAPCYLCAARGDRCEAFVLPVPPRERYRAALAVLLDSCTVLDITPYNVDLAAFEYDRGRVSAQFHAAEDADRLADLWSLPQHARLHPGGTLFSREGEASWDVAGPVNVSITARRPVPVPA